VYIPENGCPSCIPGKVNDELGLALRTTVFEEVGEVLGVLIQYDVVVGFE